jgi:hypothetical protein
MIRKREDWAELWDKAKAIERRVPVRKREAWQDIARRFPDLRYKTFGNLVVARRKGRLSESVARALEQYEEEIGALTNEAQMCRQKSERLLEEERHADTRRVLDPGVDLIPPGPYPKLRDCKRYPLRRDCNYGESASSRWIRCEFMKYDNTKGPLDPDRWVCTAPD